MTTAGLRWQRREASRLRRPGPSETGRPLARLYLGSRRCRWRWRRWPGSARCCGPRCSGTGNVDSLVIAAAVALITVLGPQESARKSGLAS